MKKLYSGRVAQLAVMSSETWYFAPEVPTVMAPINCFGSSAEELNRLAEHDQTKGVMGLIFSVRNTPKPAG